MELQEAITGLVNALKTAERLDRELLLVEQEVCTLEGLIETKLDHSDFDTVIEAWMTAKGIDINSLQTVRDLEDRIGDIEAAISDFGHKF